MSRKHNTIHMNIFSTQEILAKHLGCYRQKIISKIQKGEVKQIFVDGKKIGYVLVKEALKELIK